MPRPRPADASALNSPVPKDGRSREPERTIALSGQEYEQLTQMLGEVDLKVAQFPESALKVCDTALDFLKNKGGNRTMRKKFEVIRTEAVRRLPGRR